MADQWRPFTVGTNGQNLSNEETEDVVVAAVSLPPAKREVLSNVHNCTFEDRLLCIKYYSYNRIESSFPLFRSMIDFVLRPLEACVN